MKGLFQRLVGRRERAPKKGDLRLAAFGKHPGWDDHIGGIGIESELLANIKQVLYVRGIGGQIDSGAWEKLEPDKRVQGFDHTFLWLTPGHSVLGCFWSSTDRKGRAKYPMVLCVQGDSLSPEFLVEKVRPELERLRDACKATTSADQVKNECVSAQARLDALLVDTVRSPFDQTARTEMRQRFLNCPELGPDRQGLLRVLHELNNSSGGAGGKGADARARQLRVPLCNDSASYALLLWRGFLRCALPENLPLLLISRGSVDWIDVVIGEPQSDDLFCLQASAKALPLATSIPYELSPELTPRLRELETKFLGNTTPPIAAVKEPGASNLPAGAISTTKPDAPQAHRAYGVFLVCALAIIGGAGAWYSLTRGSSNREAAKPPSQLAATPESVARRTQPSTPPSTIASNKNLRPDQEATQPFRDSVSAGKEALEAKNYDAAILSFTNALALVPDDPEVKELVRKAQGQQRQAQTEAAFARAVEAAKHALQTQQLDVAQKQLQTALALKPNDPRALELSVHIKQQEQALKTDQFKKDLDAARLALTAQKYDEAIRLAQSASESLPGQSAATQLIARATELKQTAAAYNTALEKTKLALANADYSAAIAQGNAALKLKPGDPAARQLIDRATNEIARLAKAEADRNAVIAKAKEIAVATSADDAPATEAPEKELSAPPRPQAADEVRATPVAARSINPDATAKVSTRNDIEKYDLLLKNLMIQLHVKSQGKNILTNGGTAAPLRQGILPASAIDQYLQSVESLRTAYKGNEALDPERQKILDKLKDAIRYWNL